MCSIKGIDQIKKAFDAYFERYDPDTKWSLRNGIYSHHAWWPKPIEVASCCVEIREPTLYFNRTMKKHCLTIVHVATLYGVDYNTLKKRIVASPAYAQIKADVIAKRAVKALLGEPKWVAPRKEK